MTCHTHLLTRTHTFLFLLASLLLLFSASLPPRVWANQSAYTLFTQRDGLADDFVTDIAFDTQGNAWIGTLNGVTRIEGRKWTTFTREHGLGDSWVNAIQVSPDGGVWFATQSGGLSVFDGQKFTTYNLDNSTIPSNFITALAIDSKGIVWVGTLRDGVARFDPNVNRWTRYALPNNFVTALTLDAKELPYVATDGGVFRYDGQTWKSDSTKTDNREVSSLAAQVGIAPKQIRAWKRDARGRAWVGTPHGLYVSNEIVESLRPERPLPVVLVHGWTGPESDKIEDSEFRYLQKYAERDGIPVFYAERVSPKNTLYQNAENLHGEIARVRNLTSADKVNVIGFSMGGLNTRAYLESSLYANDVNRVIIVGTPHQGEEIWYPLLVQLILGNPDRPSGFELTPESARLFNATHSPRASVPYDLLMGDARRQTNLDFLADLPASDALVSVYSALNLDAPNVRKAVNADLHAFSPTAVPFELTSFLYPHNTYERYLRNALRDTTALRAPLGGEISVTPTLTLTQPAPRNHTPVVGMHSEIYAGETITREIYIDANRAARFIAYYPGGEFDFSLTAPDGKKYTDADSFLDGVNRPVKLKADIANFTGYAVKNATVGKWLLTLKRADKGADGVDVLTYADLEAGARLNIAVDRRDVPAERLYAGDSITVRATLSNRVPNLSVRARVVDPIHNEQALELFDDGGHGDEKAKDGIYGNTVSVPTSGHYVVVVSAAGDKFERGAEITFPVASAAARLGEVAAVEKTDDGLLARMRVNVKQAGQYALSATLRTSLSPGGRGVGGEVVARISTTSLKLDEGEMIVPLLFPSRDLRVRGINGPYVLDLVLMDTRGAAIALDEKLGAFTTPAYNVAEFK